MTVERWVREAVAAGASDIHFDPRPDGVTVRFRIDGLLQSIAHLDSTEPMELPRETALLQLDERRVEVRVSRLPGRDGERLRLQLAFPADLRGADELGLQPAQDEALGRILAEPGGWLPILGPPGSGRSTFLAHALQRVADASLASVLLTDGAAPEIESLAVAEPTAGLSWPALIDAALRQDCDTIALDRAAEDSAADALRLAFGGRRLLSTWRADGAVDGLLRLLQLAPPFRLAAALSGLVASRLVRTICESCARDTAVTDYAAAAELGLDPRGLRHREGAGCEACRQTGFRGRAGIFEVVEVTAALRNAIAAREPAEVLREQAFATGLPDFATAAAELVVAGRTTPGEAARALLCMSC